jgi:LPXTG-motif cell wall-anchored protein
MIFFRKKETEKNKGDGKMKTSLKLLGVCCLAAGMMMGGNIRAFAESSTEESSSIEVANSTSESDAIVNEESSTSEQEEEPTQSSAPVKSDKQALQVSYLSYSIGSKSFSGIATPNTSVYVTIPSTGTQKVIEVDDTRHFFVSDEYTPGMEVTFVVHDKEGETGEPMTYKIPTQEEAEALRIRDVSFDHTTKQLVGKTAPNATVKVNIGSGQGIYSSDDKGNFVISESFKPGAELWIAATVNDVVGETFKYTIPEETVTSTTKSSKEQVADTNSSDEKGLPHTGENNSFILLSVGVLVVLAAGYIIVKRKFTPSH